MNTTCQAETDFSVEKLQHFAEKLPRRQEAIAIKVEAHKGDRAKSRHIWDAEITKAGITHLAANN